MKNVIIKQLTTRYFQFIVLATLFVYLVIGIYYLLHHELTLYGDAKARLLIARGTIDSLTPGLVQLGGVWPPFPQLFYLLTIWNNFFFYSGLSGMIISIGSGVLAAYFLAKLLYEVTKDKLVTTISLAVVVLNPSFLYMSLIPMSEVLFMAFTIMSVYFFNQWMQSKKVIYLPLSAFGAMIATLTRYEGVLLPIFSVILIIAESLSNKKKFVEIKGLILFYATPAFLGIVSWLGYNQLIFGNFIHFVSGETLIYSRAGGQSAGALTRYNLFSSLSSYAGASILIAGIISCVTMALSIELMAYSGVKKYIKPALLIISPLIFTIISLYLGASDIYTPYNSSYLYNVRLGLFILPFIALCYAFLLSLSRLRYVAIFLLAVQTILLFSTAPATFQEPSDSANASRNKAQVKVTTWLEKHPTKGRVLISFTTNQTVVFDAKIPLHSVISENNGIYWRNALLSPNYQVRRIILSPIDGDAVWKAKNNNPHFLDRFKLSYTNNYYNVYDLE